MSFFKHIIIYSPRLSGNDGAFSAVAESGGFGGGCRGRLICFKGGGVWWSAIVGTDEGVKCIVLCLVIGDEEGSVMVSVLCHFSSRLLFTHHG